MSEPPAQGGEWRPIADQIATHVKDFIDGVDALARGGGDETVPMLLLEVSQILLAGAQLGASRGKLKIQKKIKYLYKQNR